MSHHLSQTQHIRGKTCCPPQSPHQDLCQQSPYTSSEDLPRNPVTHVLLLAFLQRQCNLTLTPINSLSFTFCHTFHFPMPLLAVFPLCVFPGFPSKHTSWTHCPYNQFLHPGQINFSFRFQFRHVTCCKILPCSLPQLLTSG